LLDGYTQLDDCPETMPAIPRGKQIREALNRIIDLYEAWDKPAKAAEYRAMLPAGDESSTGEGERPQP
jgi:hypothetical protein